MQDVFDHIEEEQRMIQSDVHNLSEPSCSEGCNS